MAKEYDVVIRIPGKILGALTDLIEQEGGELLSATTSAAPPTPRAKRQRHRMPRKAGAKIPTCTAKDFILEVLKGGFEMDTDTIKKKFVAEGFAENSASPAISFQVAAGRVAQTKPKHYRIAPKK